MAERGAPPKVPAMQRRVLKAVQSLTTPFLPDDYLELINPLWSTRELRGKIVNIDRETADAATVVIKPGYAWEGHKPGQYLRIGVEIEGVKHWRAYSLTSEPDRPDGHISVTVKCVDDGIVSPYLVRRGRPGTIVSLGGVEGDFVLPEALPDKLLFISAGSGITPIMSMLRSIARRGAMNDVVLLHSADDESEGSKPILVAGEDAGLDLPYGCREGICHTCVGELCSGRVRDLRNGNVYGQEGVKIRTCISAPEGPVEINL